MNILIIEDEYSLADALAEKLKSEKFNVCIKTNGEDGEDEALTESYDLILLDVMMPKCDGWSVLRQIRQNLKVPIIMLTARGEEQDELFGFELGVDEYISKPFSPKILVARIQAILKRTNTEKEEIRNLGGTTKVKFKIKEIDFFKYF